MPYDGSSETEITTHSAVSSQWYPDGTAIRYLCGSEWRVAARTGDSWDTVEDTVFTAVTGAKSLHGAGGYLFAVYDAKIDVIDGHGKVVGTLVSDLNMVSTAGAFCGLGCDTQRVYLAYPNPDGGLIVYRADIKDLSNVKMFVTDVTPVTPESTNFLGGQGDYRVIRDNTDPSGFLLRDDVYDYFGSFAVPNHDTDSNGTPAKPFDLQALLCGAGETCCVNGDRIYIFRGSDVAVVNPDGSRAPFFSLGDADVVLDGLYRSADGQHIVFTGRRQSNQCLTTFAVPVTDGVFGEASESVGWSHGQIQADADGFWYLATIAGPEPKHSEMHYRPFARDFGRSLTALGAPYEWTKDGNTFYYTSETDQLYRRSRPAGKRWYDGNGADTTVLADLTGADSLHLSGGYLFAVYGGRIDVLDRAGKVVGTIVSDLNVVSTAGAFCDLRCDGSRVYLAYPGNDGGVIIYRADIKDLSNLRMFVIE